MLNMIFKFAVKKDLIPYNIMDKVEYEPPAKQQRKKVMIVDDDTYQALLIYSKQMTKYHFLIKVLYYTGLRIAEAQALTWDDLNKKQEIFTVDKAYKRTNTVGSTKTKTSKIGVLHTALVELIEEIRMWQTENKEKFGGAYQENNLIICNEDGSYIKYSAIKSYFERASKKIGVEIRPHMFRHTFISSLIIRKNINPKVVQALAGHSKIGTTMDIYTEFFGGKYDPEIKKDLDKAFQKDYIKV